jgi:hypothetical protein
MPDEHPGVLPYLVFSWRCQMLHPTQGSDKSPWIKEQSGNSLPSPASSPISSLPSHCSPSLIRLWPHYPSLYPSNPSGPPHPSARVILRCLTAAFFLLVLFLFLLLLCLSSSSFFSFFSFPSSSSSFFSPFSFSSLFSSLPLFLPFFFFLTESGYVS